MSRHHPRARTGEDRTSLYDDITNKIIAELEAGRVPWVQPWGTAAATAPLAMPKSAATGRQYSGVNILILWGAATEHAFTGQSWLTFRQALSLGGHVRKGERGTTVVYADRFVVRSTNSAARARTVRKRRPFRSSSASHFSTSINARACLRRSQQQRRLRRQA
ncbi:antirestriction protein ArdC [Bradyrhizobium sp. LB7.1]